MKICEMRKEARGIRLAQFDSSLQALLSSTQSVHMTELSSANLLRSIPPNFGIVRTTVSRTVKSSTRKAVPSQTNQEVRIIHSFDAHFFYFRENTSMLASVDTSKRTA